MNENKPPERQSGRLKREKYLERWQRLKSQRTLWETLWREVRDFLLPRRGFFSEQGDQPNDGRKRHAKIFDSRPTKSLRNLAALMQSGLTSPARPWLKIGLADSELAGWGPVRGWLDHTESMLYQALGRSNFYSSIHNVYKELAGFGTGCLYEEEDWQGYVRFRTLTVGEYCAALDGQGRVDTVYREIPLTARQMIQRWGEDRVSPAVSRAMKSDPYQYFSVLHVVQPRHERDVTKAGRSNKPFESVFMELEGRGRILWEGGYDEFPYMVPRWDVSMADDVYGRSPGMDALADVKTLNELCKAVIKAVHMEIEPPMLVPPNYKDRLDLLPGALIYDELHGGEGIRPLYQVRPSLQAAQVFKQDLLSAIREGFFNDLFVFLMNRANVTATEIAERHEEKLLLLGPVIERQQAELLDPVVHRTFGLLRRAGVIAPAPEEIHGQPLKLEYISLLSQAQKLVGTQSIQSVLAFAGGAAQVDPKALDAIDVDQAVSLYADLIGVPNRIIRSADQIEKLRKQREDAEKAAQAQSQEAAAVQAAKDLSEIKTDGNSALAGLMGGA